MDISDINSSYLKKASRILVTGAAGNLGQAVINQLLQRRKFTVFATDIKQNPFQDIGKKNSNLTYKSLDCCSAEFTDWVKSIKPDQVIHLASILQLSANMSRQQAYDVDVTATKKLLDACISIAVKKFIITSSGAAYGYYEENINIITEDRPVRGNPDYFYSAHKAEVESIMQDYQLKHPQLKQLIFRPGAVLGADFAGPIVDLFQQKIIIGLMNYPGPFNFIWSDDVADYILEGVNTEITGIYNICGDGILTLAQIAKKLDKIYLPLPGWLLKLLLSIAKPLGLTQYGVEQIKFIKYRPVLSNEKIKACFQHQPRYNTEQVLDKFLTLQKMEQ